MDQEIENYLLSLIAECVLLWKLTHWWASCQSGAFDIQQKTLLTDAD